MPRYFCFFIGLVVLCVSLLPGYAAPPSRTFVSGTGSDSTSCSVSAPCRAFARAIDVVADGGEVVVLNSAGYGPVEIKKSVSIVAPTGIYAGITESSGTISAINVNGPGIRVYLKGLAINAGTSYSHGFAGVQVTDAAAVTIERCSITKFSYGVWVWGTTPVTVQNCVLSENSDGFSQTDPGAKNSIADSTIQDGQYGVEIWGGSLHLSNCVIKGNSEDGVFLKNTSAGVSIENCQLISNTMSAVHATLGSTALVSNSAMARNACGVYVESTAKADVDGCRIFWNGIGLRSFGTTIRVANTSITKNGNAIFSQNAGPILSRTPSSNTVEGNIDFEAFTGNYAGK